MIDRPSLLETPNLANKSTFIESPVPGESVDDCYAWDSLIRGDYDGSDTSEWEDGKQVQETLPAAQWDAMIHDITALSYQLSQVCNSLWEEMYCIIHGAQAGMSQEAITSILSNSQTLTNKTISFDDNTLQNIASLNTAQTLTNKTISFDDNTLQNVASLNTAQTLTNKTIDFKDNTIKNSPTVISSSQSLTPVKDMNIVIDTASVTLTLGDGPYIGYRLPITAKASCSLSYTGIGGTVSESFTDGKTSTYIWKGTYWDIDAVDAVPAVITSTQTVYPLHENAYIIGASGITIQVDNGVYVSQKISVTADYAGTVYYYGVNGNTSQSLDAGYRADLAWNGTYWLMSIYAVIEGRTASGAPFAYGGSISTAAIPGSGITITTDGSTLNPGGAVNFILNISTSGAACSLASGITMYQKVDILNIGNYSVLISYEGSGGTTVDIVPQNGKRTFIWLGTYWKVDIEDFLKPAIGVPTLWMGTKPDWALDFGNGSSTQYLWANYPELDTTQFKDILTTLATAGWMSAYDATGFYVPDLRGVVPIGYGTNAVRTGETTSGGTLAQYLASANKSHKHTASASFSGDQVTGTYIPRARSDGAFGTNSASGAFSAPWTTSVYELPYGSPVATTVYALHMSFYPSGTVTPTINNDGTVSKPPTLAVMWIVRFE